MSSGQHSEHKFLTNAIYLEKKSQTTVGLANCESFDEILEFANA